MKKAFSGWIRTKIALPHSFGFDKGRDFPLYADSVWKDWFLPLWSGDWSKIAKQRKIS